MSKLVINRTLSWITRLFLPVPILLALFRPELLVFYGGFNLFVYILYREDKFRAIHDRWRISEATLLLCAFLGGAVGAELGRLFGRHKTQKIVFSAVICAGVFLQTEALIRYRNWSDPAPFGVKSSPAKSIKPPLSHHTKSAAVLPH